MKKEPTQRSIKGKLIGIIATIAIFFMSNTSIWAKPLILKFGTVEPPQAWITANVIKPFLKDVENAAGGTIKIEMFTAGTLGRNPSKYLKGVKDGVMDIGFIINAYQPGRFPDDEVVNAPFVANNAMEASLAVNRMIENGDMRGYDQFVFLGVFCTNQYGIHSTFPVKKPVDLAGKKFRLGGKIQYMAFEDLGGTPVAITAPKMAESISRGIISGIINCWDAMTTFKALQLTKHHTNIPFGATIISLAMNKKVYNSLPPEARAAFEKYKGKPLVVSYSEKLIERERATLEETRNNPKHHVYTPASSELDMWKTKMLPAVERWTTKHPRGKILLDTYRTEIAKIRENQ